MNPERLLQNFDRLIGTPDAVLRLRRFILDLAVRGKLVEQTPEDEPAAELLNRIRAKKQGRAVRSLSAEDGPLAITDADTPFEIPQTWEWVYATEPAILISDNGKKVQTKDVLETGRFPVVDQGKMFIRGYCNDERKVIHVESSVIIFGDHTRETKLVDFDFVVGADGVKILQPIIIDPNYYFLALQWLPLNSRGYGRHFKLLRASLFPLPPLAEQHRIVTKVDELMKLCDELEATQAKREKRRDRLVVATLHGLNNGKTDGDNGESSSFEDSARFYFNHLPRLTIRPEHIQQLRQTILNLAVRGKLVPQNLEDEPASTLLNRISSEKNRIVSCKKNQRQSNVDEIDNSTQIFQVPESWSWTTYRELAVAFRYGISKKCSYGEKGNPVLRIPNVSSGRITTDDLKYTKLTKDEAEDLSLSVGDILMVRSNGSLNLVGRPALVEEHVQGFYYAGYLVRVRFIPGTVDSKYLISVLNSKLIRDQIELPIRSAVGLKNVNTTEFGNLRIPLPPLAEQHRIVAKVDELMKLCDELEAGITINTKTSRHLLEATLQEALSG